MPVDGDGLEVVVGGHGGHGRGWAGESGVVHQNGHRLEPFGCRGDDLRPGIGRGLTAFGRARSHIATAKAHGVEVFTAPRNTYLGDPRSIATLA
ncbi:hypothetical protein [Actinomadura sp. 21ATH]|uniref:hypothetical protein n=1 Tax=Actinomadura sp. 21ATH TaxID=1735444 RepID=UPI0035C1AA7B